MNQINPPIVGKSYFKSVSVSLAACPTPECKKDPDGSWGVDTSQKSIGYGHPNEDDLAEVGRVLRDHTNPAPMPGYGQIFVRAEDGHVWYVGGDGDDDGFSKLVEKKLGEVSSVRRVTYEAEGFPPHGAGWVQVFPRNREWKSLDSDLPLRPKLHKRPFKEESSLAAIPEQKIPDLRRFPEFDLPSIPQIQPHPQFVEEGQELEARPEDLEVEYKSLTEQLKKAFRQNKSVEEREGLLQKHKELSAKIKEYELLGKMGQKAAGENQPEQPETSNRQPKVAAVETSQAKPVARPPTTQSGNRPQSRPEQAKKQATTKPLQQPKLRTQESPPLTNKLQEPIAPKVEELKFELDKTKRPEEVNDNSGLKLEAEPEDSGFGIIDKNEEDELAQGMADEVDENLRRKDKEHEERLQKWAEEADKRHRENVERSVDDYRLKFEDEGQDRNFVDDELQLLEELDRAGVEYKIEDGELQIKGLSELPEETRKYIEENKNKFVREIEKKVLTQHPVEEKRNNGGVNESYVYTFEDSSKGIFKPFKGESEDLMKMVGGALYKREAATSDVAEALGLIDLVPTTTAVNDGDRKGSVQKFSKNSMEAANFDDFHMWDGEEDLAKAAAFDYLTGNFDRHSGNWMLNHDRPGGKLVLIDNGASFPQKERSSWALIIGRAFYSKNRKGNGSLQFPKEIKQWDWNKVEKVLKRNGIGPEAIKLTKQRFDELQKFNDFNELLAKGKFYFGYAGMGEESDRKLQELRHWNDYIKETALESKEPELP